MRAEWHLGLRWPMSMYGGVHFPKKKTQTHARCASWACGRTWHDTKLTDALWSMCSCSNILIAVFHGWFGSFGSSELLNIQYFYTYRLLLGLIALVCTSIFPHVSEVNKMTVRMLIESLPPGVDEADRAGGLQIRKFENALLSSYTSHQMNGGARNGEVCVFNYKQLRRMRCCLRQSAACRHETKASGPWWKFMHRNTSLGRYGAKSWKAVIGCS